jgi:hypothetical protein
VFFFSQDKLVKFFIYLFFFFGEIIGQLRAWEKKPHVRGRIGGREFRHGWWKVLANEQNPWKSQ